MRIVALSLHQLEDFNVENLHERTHIGKVSVHGTSEGKVVLHALHQLTETAVRKYLCKNQHVIIENAQKVPLLTIIEDDQKWCHQIAHSLDITHLHVLPHVCAHDVAQFF